MHAKLSGICKILIKTIPLTLQVHQKPKSEGTESDEEDVNEMTAIAVWEQSKAESGTAT